MDIQIPGLKNPVQKILLYRISARILDLSIALFFATILTPPLGAFCSFAFMLLCDRCSLNKMHTGSPGKQLFQLCVTSNNTTLSPIDVKTCLLRNITLAFPTLFLNAGPFGWILFILIGLPIAGFEILLLIKHPKNQRLGDILANTYVNSINSSFSDD